MLILDHASSEETVELEIDDVGEILGHTAHGYTLQVVEILAI